MVGAILYIKFFDSKILVKLIISLLCSVYLGFKLNLTFGFKKCPECFGDEFCEFFQNRQIQLTWFSYFLSVVNPKITKSVFHAVFNGSQSIVIKRKAGRVENFQLNDVELNNERAQNFILCPGVQSLDFLFSQIEDGSNKGLWGDLSTSIEPLLMMYFQPSWPVPKYYGACGDAIIEEYKGEPLSNFLISDFHTRVFLSIHLLKMAHLFTFGDPQLIFYFTDYSLHNLVVDPDGNVTLVDLDNVVIFNKTAGKGDSVRQSIHTSLVLHDSNYAFSASDLCSHYLSDHNYFSICRYLLTHPEEGLLREIPKDLLDTNAELLYLLNECSEPKTMNNRISAGQKLLVVLEDIIKAYKWKL